MIRFATGDMFETPAQIRVNAVNCVGVMGAGIARVFRERYPAMFVDYQRVCRAGRLSPGTLHVWQESDGSCVVNLPTKRHWRDTSRYADVEAGLVALHDFLAPRRDVTVTLPALGCGLGELEWPRVAQAMRAQLADIAADVIAFAPLNPRRI